LGRLSRTSAYVTATTYGALPEVDAAVDIVKRIHKRVNGVSERGVRYDASDPAFSAWVHNALTDSFLVANQIYGAAPLSPGDADTFVREQRKVGALLYADPMPETAADLHIWVAEHPAVAASQAMRDAVAFINDPPLSRGIAMSYKVLRNAAVATIPVRIRHILGLTAPQGSRASAKAAVAGLRWAMGFSPTWKVALIRTGSVVPEGLFRQPIPIALPVPE
ncbi:MAG TPA: oxygenase MpaB family protein, partial [Acidimicrobiia bacterium]